MLLVLLAVLIIGFFANLVWRWVKLVFGILNFDLLIFLTLNFINISKSVFFGLKKFIAIFLVHLVNYLLLCLFFTVNIFDCEQILLILEFGGKILLHL